MKSKLLLFLALYASCQIALAQAPTITDFSPTSGQIGTTVIINGSGFTGTTSVRFGEISAPFTVNSSTRLTVTVPRVASTQLINVTNANGFVLTTSPFTVTRASSSVSFSLVSSNFASVSGSTNAAPAVGDLDNDQLLDLLVGRADGTIVRYEQTTLNGTTFTNLGTLKNASNASISAGTQASVAIVDFDGNGRFSILLGRGSGTVDEYEQTSVGASTFTLVTNNFADFTTGSNTVPSMTDLNGNGSLDIILGKGDGIISHSEQNTKNTHSFYRIDTNFNNLQLSGNDAPFCVDLDGNGLIDILVGVNTGTIYRFEQGGVGSYSVNQLSSNFNSISAGTNAHPCITDIDGDGLLDLLVGRGDGTITRYEQSGSGNQAPTDISLSPASVNENQSVGTTVGTLSSTDPNPGNTFTYNFATGGTDNSLFSISGNTLTTNGVFNYEGKNSYSIKIRTTDQGGQFFEKTLTVSVNNVVETPTITSFSPTTGLVGTSVTINGNHFNDAGNVTVRFNGTTASTVSVNSNSQLMATVPSGATTGTISVQNADGTGSSTSSFTVTPQVSSVSVPANATYGIGTTLSFSVAFSQSVTVTGTPNIPLTVGSTARAASYVSGSGTSTLVFSYVVANGDLDTDGVTLGSTINLNGGTIRNSGVNASLALNNVASTTGVRVDGVAPTVNITSSASNPTSTSPIPLSITFSESVTNFAVGDITVINGTKGTLSGSGANYTLPITPSGTGTVSITISVAANVATDAAGNGNTVSNTFAITFSPPPTIANFRPVNNTVCIGSPITFTATIGNVTGSYTYTVTNGSSTSIAGSSSSAAFSQSLTASSSGSQTFTLRIIGNSQTTTATTSVTVNALPTASLTNNGPLTCAQTSVTLTASGGSSYTFVNSSGTVLGTSGASTTQMVTAPGTYSVKVTNTSGCVSTTSTTVTSNTATVTVTNPTTSTGTQGMAFSQTFTASGGATPRIFSLAGGTLPNGLSLSSTGVLSGTPTQSGSFSVTVRATDANDCSNVSNTYALTVVNNTPTIAGFAAVDNLVCVGLPLTFTATIGNTSGSYNYTLTNGSSTTTGTAANTNFSQNLTPSVASSQAFTLTVSNNNQSARATTNVTITPPLAATLTANFGGTLTCAQTSLTLTSSGGTRYYFERQGGGGVYVVSGIPYPPREYEGFAYINASGVYSVTVTNDFTGCVSTASTTIYSNTATISVTNPATTIGTVNAPFSQTFTASGGVAPRSFSLASGTLPTGLTLSTSGVLSGTPTQSGSFSLTVRATDANGCSGVSVPYSLSVSPAQAPCGAVVYVTQNGAGLQDGSSWTNAFSGTALQTAINTAATCGAQVWVAAGIYKPTTNPADKTASFVLKSGIAIYGGFAGNESALSQRSALSLSTPSSTTLSGDIDSDGTLTGNSYHVVYGTPGLTATAVLDGFVIANGNADPNAGYPNYYGGGLFNEKCSPTIRNCFFLTNRGLRGGAVCNFGLGGTSSPQYINCGFISNVSTSFAGAMFNAGNNSGHSSPQLINCSFISNTANFGGAIANDGSSSGSASPQLTNCSFLSNSANSGGAFWSQGAVSSIPGSSNTYLTNCVFFTNGGGSTIYNDGSATVSATYSLFEPCVTGYVSGPGNLTTTTSPFISTNSTQLNAFSPAINAGTNSASGLSGITTDLAGNPRFYNGGTVDMGAYEFQGEPGQLTGITAQPVAGSTVCVGGTVTAGVSVSGTGPFTYQWYKDGTTVAGQITTTLSLTNVQTSDAGSYSVVVTGAGNSVTSTAFSLTVNTPPAVSIAANPSLTITQGSSTLLTASGATSYTWSTGASTAAISVSMAGTYSVTATSAGCSSVTSVVVSVTAATLTLAGFAVSPAVVCVGSPVTFTATVGNVTGSYAYTLTNGSSTPLAGNTASSAFSQTLTAAGSGSQSFTLTVSANGQSATAMTSITVNSLPNAGLTNNGPLTCAQTSVTLTASGGSSYAFANSGGMALAGSGNTRVVSMADVYSVTVTNASGCSTTASTAVMSNTAVVTVSNPTINTVAISAAISQTFTASGGVSPYSFSLVSGPLPTGLSLSSTGVLSGSPTQGGSFTITVRGTDANGCSSLSSAYVLTVDAIPTIADFAASPSTVCVGSPTTFTASIGNVPNGYTWNLSNGSSSIGSSIPTTATTFSAVLTATGTGIQTFTLSVTANGQTTTALAGLTVNALPTANLTNNGPLTCAQTSVTLTADGGSIYRFADANGTVLASNSNTQVISTAGIYSVTVTNAGGCSGTAITTVLSNTLAPSVSITASATTLCMGQSSILTASGADTYQWSTMQTTPGISVSLTGTYSVTGTTLSNGCFSVVSQFIQVNDLPTVSINGLASTYCRNADPVTLTGTPANGTFTVDGVVTSTFTPASLSVGQHTVGYAYTNANGCSNTTSQMVEVKEVPLSPTLLTQSGHPYPAGVSSLTLSQNVGSVIITASGCAGGSITWAGGNATTLAVSTADAGVFIVSATCSSNGCTSSAATATITVVPSTFAVLHRDADYGNTQDGIIRPYLQLSNTGNNPIPYGELTVRYWFTSEGSAPPTDLSVYYAQLGAVQMRYVTLPQPRQGAYGYVEYSFPGGGNLQANSNSGPIENGIQKTDRSAFNELDDHSYMANYSDYTANGHITAYRNGVIVWGQEPTEVTGQATVKVYSAAKDQSTTSQIQTRIELRNEGNVAINAQDLKFRYYFTSDNGQTANVYVDYAAIGAQNVQAQVVRLNQPVNGADSYVELSPMVATTIAPMSSLGAIDFRIVRSDYGLLDQTNDYSYAPYYGNVGLNTHITAYLGGNLVFGSEPTAAPARVVASERSSVLSARVLGNPVIGSNAIVEISGAKDQTVILKLVDLHGRLVHDHRIEQAGDLERVNVPVGTSQGTLLLQVSTATQQQQLKLLRP